MSDRPLAHGGDLDWARRRFPDAPEPWVDLSTGINPIAYRCRRSRRRFGRGCRSLMSFASWRRSLPGLMGSRPAPK